MTLLNVVLTRVSDLVLAPLASVPPLWAVLALALVTALVVLGVMRLTSNQAAVAEAKRLIQADLLEMRLYNDDVRALLRAQGGILRHNGRYIWLSFVPLIVTAIPLTLGIAQLQSYYGYTGLPVGVPALLTVDLQDAAAASVPLRLEGSGLDVEAGPIVFPSLGQVVWRVVPTAAGDQTVRVQAGDRTVEKTWSSSTGVARRSPQRERPGFVSQLLYPSEAPLVDGPIRAIRVPYPERSVRVAGWEMHWLVLFVAASFVFVLALRKPLGVVI
jgi:hypothetical protein